MYASKIKNRCDSDTISKLDKNENKILPRLHPGHKGGGFIFTTNVMELEGCDPELVQVWVDAVKEFGVY